MEHRESRQATSSNGVATQCGVRGLGGKRTNTCRSTSVHHIVRQAGPEKEAEFRRCTPIESEKRQQSGNQC